MNATQQSLFDLTDKDLTKPVHYPCYELGNVPSSLQTQRQWASDGFKVNEKRIEAYVWDNEWVPLYSSHTTKPIKKIIHMPGVRSQIVELEQELADIDAFLTMLDGLVEQSITYKAQAKTDAEEQYHAAVLTVATGNKTEWASRRKELEKELRKLTRKKA